MFFLIEDLKFGGVEVSLINLLNSAEFEKHGYQRKLIDSSQIALLEKQLEKLQNLMEEKF